MSERESGVPIEQFIQALTSQLDRAQATMALKARAGLPLTFAVKDLSLDLRTHVEMVGSVVHVRPAGPGETDASTLHLALTTITRPMIEENTRQLAVDPDEPPLKDVLDPVLSPNEQRRLEWAGINTVTQLRTLQQRNGEAALERLVDIPVNRLRLALERASHPFITQIVPEEPAADGGSTDKLVRVHGHNLMQDRLPDVHIAGQTVSVVDSSKRSLLLAPLPHQMKGTLMVRTAPGQVAEKEFNLQPLVALRPGTRDKEGSP